MNRSAAVQGSWTALTEACLSRGIDILYDARAVGLAFRRQETSQAWWCAAAVSGPRRCPPTLWCWPAAVSKPTRSGALAISALDGNWPACAATRFNTGDGIRMALNLGAAAYGNWSGCHAVGWDRNAPEFGDLAVGDQFQKHSYPFGIMVNAHGRRFVDEGADFRNYTYVRYGVEIMNQPGQFAWQSLRRQDRAPAARRVPDTASDACGRGLAGGVGRPARRCGLGRLSGGNPSVQQGGPYGHRPSIPTSKTDAAPQGLPINKSNWANTVDQPPFEAYAVTCGITFTFGGLRVNPDAQVLDSDLRPIPGLYAAGELVGGLFYNNYPGGAGLMSGSVFGKIAGTSAARG